MDAGARAAAGEGRRRAERRPLWIWWVPVVFAVSLPVVGFTRQPQWDRVHLTPFSDPEDKLRDQLVNIALFVPFGYLHGRRRGRGAAVPGAMALAALVSAGAEATQLFSVQRNPSATDVLMAMAGAAAGSLLAKRRGGG